MDAAVAPLNETLARQEEKRHQFWVQKTAPGLAALLITEYHAVLKMAPDSVPKSGTKIGAAFYDDSTSLD